MDESLGEALPKEIKRVQELIGEYKSVPMGHIAAGLMESDVECAVIALARGDVVAMINFYQALKGWN